MLDQLLEHMKRNDLFEPIQSAYHVGHSTKTALLAVQNDVLMAMDRQEVVALILLDMSAAFDTVSHTVLLQRMSDRLGITSSALKWFHSYLTDRMQQIRVNDSLSLPFPLSCGVPQGSVLGPFLFTIYTSLLGELVTQYGLRYHLYADDTQLYLSFKPSSNSTVPCFNRIEECVAKIQEWMVLNRLKLNSNKTEFLLIGTHQQRAKIHQPSIDLPNSTILPKDHNRYLGIVFNSSLGYRLRLIPGSVT